MTIASNITALKVMAGVRRESYAKAFEELETIAKIESVKASNAIEGIVTTDKRIREMVKESSAPLNHTEAEIAGYRDVLNEIHTNFAAHDLTEAEIRGFHSIFRQRHGLGAAAESGFRRRGERAEADVRDRIEGRVELQGGADRCGRNLRGRVAAPRLTENGQGSNGFTISGTNSGTAQQLIGALTCWRASDLTKLHMRVYAVLPWIQSRPYGDSNGTLRGFERALSGV